MTSPPRSAHPNASQDKSITKPEKIYVKISYPKSNRPAIKCSHTLPPARAILRHLTQEQQNQITRCISVYDFTTCEDLIRDCRYESYNIKIRAVDWSAAIAKAIAENIRTDTGHELEFVAAAGPAYLAIGNSVFELRATDMLHTPVKALPALRKRALADAKVEADALIAKANEDAENTRRAARQDANRVQVELTNSRDEIARIRRDINNMHITPQWLVDAGLPHRYHRNHDPYTMVTTYTFEIQLLVPITIASFYYDAYNPQTNTTTRCTWNAIPKRPVTFPIWLKLAPDGKYSFKDMNVDSNFPGTLPHISFESSCMELGDAPTHINSTETLNALITSLSRVHSIVNLSSLLGPVRNWHTVIKRACPRPLWQLICRGNASDWSQVRDTLPCDSSIILTLDNTPMTITVPPVEPSPATSEPDADAIDAEYEEI